MVFLRFADPAPYPRRAFDGVFALCRPRAVPSKSISAPFCSSPRRAEHGEEHFPIFLRFADPAPFPRRAFWPLFAPRHAEQNMAKSIFPFFCALPTPRRSLEEHFGPFLLLATLCAACGSAFFHLFALPNVAKNE